MAKPFNLENFLKLSAEDQAKAVERQTAELVRRLPSLKKQLKMYGEVSDELYNLNEEEVKLYGTEYARALRFGEIKTESGKQAYRKFIKDLNKYTRTSIGELAYQTAEKRMDSWLETIDAHASAEEKKYAHELVDSMTEQQKLGFTRSQYFLNNENWGSEQTFIQDTNEGKFSIQTLKLELYLETWTGDVNGIYNNNVATDGEMKLRGSARGKKAKRRS